MGNRNLVKIDSDLQDLIPKYIQNRVNDISICKESIKNNNYQPISEIGHKIKGNAATYGFVKLSEIGSRLEMSAINKNEQDIIQTISEFEEYLEGIEIEYVKV